MTHPQRLDWRGVVLDAIVIASVTVLTLTGTANLFVFLALIGPLIGARLAAGRAGFAAHAHGGSTLVLLLVGLFGVFRRAVS
jgi:hypothetical protein